MTLPDYPLMTGGGCGYLRIATEEAFCTPELMQRFRRVLDDRSIDDPGFYSLWGFYGGTSERARLLSERIQDLGEGRLNDMDAAGIDVQILSLTSPGVQIFKAAEGSALAIAANDYVADAVSKHPRRFAALAAIAPQDPLAASREILRSVKTLGLRGVIVNSHTQNEYLDAPKFFPIFETAEACGVPIYLHPSTPSKQLIPAFLERGLEGAIFGFGVETGLHALRLISAGVFDRFPKLQVVLGHLGEALPFWMWRIDFMHGASARAGRERTQRLELRPSEYLQRNFSFTTSGLAFEPAIRYVQDVVGMDRVMYAMDYPYQYVTDEVRVQDNLSISLENKRRFFQTNAERVFQLKAAVPGTVGT